MAASRASIANMSGLSSSTPPASTTVARPPAISAAPRPTASSPATRRALTVMDEPWRPSAIALAAAIVFITVFGKASGESPPAPRRR